MPESVSVNKLELNVVLHPKLQHTRFVRVKPTCQAKQGPQQDSNWKWIHNASHNEALLCGPAGGGGLWRCFLSNR